MGKLTCDDRRTGAEPMRVAEALALIREGLPATAGVETVALSVAGRRILASDIAAPMDLPPFDNAAVDGYALRSSDIAASGPITLPIAGRVAAGAAAGEVPPGAAMRIFTGAPMPVGADAVVMQEDVRAEGGKVTLHAKLAPGANRRRAGEDVGRGRVALPGGLRLGPHSLALAAALGFTDLPVRRALRVGLFSTGDEVTEAGSGLAPAGIHDANRPMLMALVAQAGALPVDLGILRDARVPLQERLVTAASTHDLLVTSGGVSVGEEDHVRAAVGAAGDLSFWRLAIKPGRPLAFGHVAGTPFVGLPGNPGAAYVTALAMLLPLLTHLSGGREEAPLPAVRSGFALEKRKGRREYLKVSLRIASDGLAEAMPAPGGALSGLAASDGFAELAEDLVAIRPGDLLPFRAHPRG